jgi:Flp pilus assembly protein TadG
MMTLRRRLQSRRDVETGATLVEFALVAPLVFLLIFGLISGCYLTFQNSSLHDGATAGARMASIETALLTADDPATGAPWPDGQYCESGAPSPIQKAVAGAAPLVPVNQAPLCATSASADTLTQASDGGNDANIIVTCGVSCAAPTSTEVSLSFAAKGIVAPFGLTYHMTAVSQDPVASP